MAKALRQRKRHLADVLTQVADFDVITMTVVKRTQEPSICSDIN